MIRLATTDDLDFLVTHDNHVPRELIERKIRDSEIYVMTSPDGERVGWLRYGLFWDLIPIMNMLYFLEPHRRKGLGRQLVERWEQDMHDHGFTMVMTSTQIDEEGQHFYRKLGYVDTGVILFPNDPAELFLRKEIGEF